MVLGCDLGKKLTCVARHVNESRGVGSISKGSLSKNADFTQNPTFSARTLPNR